MSLFPWLEEQLKDTPPFFRDTTLDVNFRTFYFYGDKFDDSKSEAWALGGAQAGEVPTPAAESVAQTLPSGVGLNLAKVEKTAR